MCKIPDHLADYVYIYFKGSPIFPYRCKKLPAKLNMLCSGYDEKTRNMYVDNTYVYMYVAKTNIRLNKNKHLASSVNT